LSAPSDPLTAIASPAPEGKGGGKRKGEGRGREKEVEEVKGRVMEGDCAYFTSGYGPEVAVVLNATGRIAT